MKKERDESACRADREKPKEPNDKQVTSHPEPEAVQDRKSQDLRLKTEDLKPSPESLKKLAKERDEFLATLQRVQADFLNYQKRIKREKEDWDRYKDEDLLKSLLPAFDNMDHTLKIKCESEDAVSLLKGIELTKREIFRVLKKSGVCRIKTTGEKFNPALHEAVEAIETEKHPEGTILEEIRSGFLICDRTLRPAQVKIAKPKTANQPPEQGKNITK